MWEVRVELVAAYICVEEELSLECCVALENFFLHYRLMFKIVASGVLVQILNIQSANLISDPLSLFH
jgi:hypothetical protein